MILFVSDYYCSSGVCRLDVFLLVVEMNMNWNMLCKMYLFKVRVYSCYFFVVMCVVGVGDFCGNIINSFF